MDRLSLIAAEAKAAGMSYGQWRALNPDKYTECKKEEAYKYEKICVGCGKSFATNKTTKKYCCEHCRISRNNYNRARKKKEVAGDVGKTVGTSL